MSISIKTPEEIEKMRVACRLAAEVLDYINIMESLREQASKPDLFDDELMNLLADALENRRARVVTEWDRVRRRADNRASTFASRKLM